MPRIFKLALTTMVLSFCVLLCAPSASAQGSVLDFPTTDDGQPVDQSYGDRLPGTPNVVVDYGPLPQADPRQWRGNYGDLVGVLYEGNDGFGVVEITFSADAGSAVTLSSFDMAGYPDTDYTINSVQVIDVANGTTLFSQSNVLIRGSSTGPTGRRTTFNFSTPLSARFLRIRFDASNLGGSSDNIGIDNIAFGQQPQQILTATLSRNAANNLVASVTLTNPTDFTAANVVVTLVRASTLDETAFVDGVPIPQSIGTVAPGQSRTVTVVFPGTSGVPPGFTGLIRVNITYDGSGGVLSLTQQVVTP